MALIQDKDSKLAIENRRLSSPKAEAKAAPAAKAEADKAKAKAAKAKAKKGESKTKDKYWSKEEQDESKLCFFFNHQGCNKGDKECTWKHTMFSKAKREAWFVHRVLAHLLEEKVAPVEARERASPRAELATLRPLRAVVGVLLLVVHPP